MQGKSNFLNLVCLLSWRLSCLEILHLSLDYEFLCPRNKVKELPLHHGCSMPLSTYRRDPSQRIQKSSWMSFYCKSKRSKKSIIVYVSMSILSYLYICIFAFIFIQFIFNS